MAIPTGSTAIGGVFFKNRPLSATGLGAMAKSMLNDGILSGCSISISNGNINLGAGYMIVSGRVCYIENDLSISLGTISSSYVEGRLKLTADMGQTSTSSAFEQAYLTVEYRTDGGTFPTLTQEDINIALTSSGKYECVVCTFTISEGTPQQPTRVVAQTSPYPVGSIYMTETSTNPHDLFGGTWEEIAGRFLVGWGNNQASGTSNMNITTQTGGEGTHQLSVSEMPSHSHYRAAWVAVDPGEGSYSVASGSTLTWGTFTVSSAGGDAAHNNIPPYYAVHIWRRTA